MSSRQLHVVLFGAGASYGSGHVLPRVPPLGINLYHDLRSFSPSWRALPPEIDSYFKQKFEKGMQVIYERYSSVISELMRHMALYFVQFELDKSRKNLYQKFVIELWKHKSKERMFILSTLNYDLLLEFALSNEDIYADYFSDQPTPDGFSVWKLHGSCNLIPGGFKTKGNFFASGYHAVNSWIKVLSPQEIGPYCNSNTMLYPVMALYMNSKPLQMESKAIKQFQDSWAEKVLAAKKVLIVGVQPNLDDQHIWKALTQTQAEIGYIGSKAGYDYWLESGRRHESTSFLSSTWNETFDKSLEFIVR